MVIVDIMLIICWDNKNQTPDEIMLMPVKIKPILSFGDTQNVRLTLGEENIM